MPALIGLGVGCDGGGCDDCDDCQAALDHLAQKLPENGCNPGVMENAVNRIDEDCGEAARASDIDAMVESCLAETSTGAQCRGGISFNAAIDFQIDPIYVDLYPDGIGVAVTDARGTEIVESALKGEEFTVVAPNIHRFVLEEVGGGNAASYGITIYDPNDRGFVFDAETVDIGLRVGPGFWTSNQTRTVLASADEDGLQQLVFLNFER